MTVVIAALIGAAGGILGSYLAAVIRYRRWH